MASPSSDLPPGWEAAVTDDGRVYYVDHINKITTYAKPEAPLPAGWTAKTAPSGDVYYQNNVTMTTQWERPVAPATAPQPGGSQGGKGFLEEGRSMLRGFKEQLRPLKAQIKEGLRAGAEDLQRKIDEGKQASASAPPMGGPSSANTDDGTHDDCDADDGMLEKSGGRLPSGRPRCVHLWYGVAKRAKEDGQGSTGVPEEMSHKCEGEGQIAGRVWGRCGEPAEPGSTHCYQHQWQIQQARGTENIPIRPSGEGERFNAGDGFGGSGSGGGGGAGSGGCGSGIGGGGSEIDGIGSGAGGSGGDGSGPDQASLSTQRPDFVDESRVWPKQKEVAERMFQKTNDILGDKKNISDFRGCEFIILTPAFNTLKLQTMHRLAKSPTMKVDAAKRVETTAAGDFKKKLDEVCDFDGAGSASFRTAMGVVREAFARNRLVKVSSSSGSYLGVADTWWQLKDILRKASDSHPAVRVEESVFQLPTMLITKDVMKSVHVAIEEHREERERIEKVERRVAGDNMAEDETAAPLSKCIRMSSMDQHMDGGMAKLVDLVTTRDSEEEKSNNRDLYPAAGSHDEAEVFDLVSDDSQEGVGEKRTTGTGYSGGATSAGSGAGGGQNQAGGGVNVNSRPDKADRPATKKRKAQEIDEKDDEHEAGGHENEEGEQEEEEEEDEEEEDEEEEDEEEEDEDWEEESLGSSSEED
eukprot:g3305.t1